jgi:hypothetical protein
LPELREFCVAGLEPTAGRSTSRRAVVDARHRAHAAHRRDKAAESRRTTRGRPQEAALALGYLSEADYDAMVVPAKMV